ncbi:hypothetical protein CO172_01260 [Candidatus Uhrbacteria bacterium CG_4_9_14_3_um_filter_36_7]|uniref:YdbS-like PH domain-containing protein n=1 Tax=Candidatus Uhrbacteria bacterium CG_4_9_14_3_um_filter_36_7 TaxID=1975033 RepID=A0A2M7XHZ1_9BACT|nr:MAG: hypothetical protein CO172_01260 [Candidatus Uhrbacteria bacterium CG_4_9_14_3_um_filter_36_7]
MIHPDHLPHTQNGEKTIFFLHRHWHVVLQIFLAILLLYLIPAIILFFFWSSTIAPLTSHPFLGPLLFLVASAYICGVWLLAFVEFVDYYLDVWIVTNKRILNIEQLGLFHRTASELPLNVVQDVTSEVKGILPTLFDFGTVYIQTAGETRRFVFKEVPHPEKVKEQIIATLEQERVRVNASAKSTVPEPLHL